MTDEPLTGGCLCGAVRYEIAEPLVAAGYCHCTRCQRRTGTASSAQGRVAPGAFRLVSGEQQLGSHVPADGGFVKVFCRECGSALWSEAPDDRELRSVRLGTFDGDPGIRPCYRQFVASAAPWEPIPDDGLPRFDGSRPR